MLSREAKVTFKSIPHYPELVIKEATCDINYTWEEFLKGFGVDLLKTAPESSFIVKSRKGTSSLFDQIERISSKYVQKFRILVTVEKEVGKAKTRRSRRKRTSAIVCSSERNIQATEKPMPLLAKSSDPGLVASPPPRSRAPPVLLPIVPTPVPTTKSCSPHLIAALKRSIVQKRIPKPNSVASQLQIRRGTLDFQQSEAGQTFSKSPPMTSGPYNYDLPMMNNLYNIMTQCCSPFPSFSSIKERPSNLNFETRVEKIDDYNVIRKSSVIWQDYPLPQLPEYPMRCFSMKDNDFIL